MTRTCFSFNCPLLGITATISLHRDLLSVYGIWLLFKAADALLPVSGSCSKAVDTGKKVSVWGSASQVGSAQRHLKTKYSDEGNRKTTGCPVRYEIPFVKFKAFIIGLI